MLLHTYVFLSTIFIGLQGAAFYRHHLKNATQIEVKSISNVALQENVQETIIQDTLSVELSDENPVEQIQEIKSPEEISNQIGIEIAEYFSEENDNTDISAEIAEDEEQIENADVQVNEQVFAAVENDQRSVDEELSDIVVFDYTKNKKTPALIADVSSRKSHSDATKELDKLLRKPQASKTPNQQSPMYYQGEYKFVIDETLDYKKIELRSLLGNEEVYFDQNNAGSIVKNFTSKESAEMFQAIYPMAMPTNVKAYWGYGKEIINYVPLLSQSFIDQLYGELGIQGEWGIVLVALNEEIQYFEMENFKSIVFLDKDFNEVEENNAQFALYLGIPAGNHDIKMITQDANINYPLYVQENIVTFVDPLLENQNIEKNFSLYEKLPMSKDYKDIYVTSDQMAPVSSNAYLEKDALNSYRFNAKSQLIGNAEQVLIQIDKQNFYINMNKIQDKIVLPSFEYINQVLDTVQEDEIVKCIIELNPIKEIDYVDQKFYAQRNEATQGKTTNYTAEEASIERYLDSDGVFYPTHSKKTKKAFFLAQDEGMMLAKIVYRDGTVENRQYFCQSKDYHLDSGDE
jgi:hypothetical protein